MKRAVFLALALTAGALVTSACQEETGKERLESSVEDYERVRDSISDVICECWDAYGNEYEQEYSSLADCKNDYDEFLPSTVRCMTRAMERDIDASNEYFDCVLPLQREYEACLNSRLTCDEVDSTDVCSTDYELGLETCIELPVSIERALDNCFE